MTRLDVLNEMIEVSIHIKSLLKSGDLDSALISIEKRQVLMNDFDNLDDNITEEMKEKLIYIKTFDSYYEDYLSQIREKINTDRSKNSLKISDIKNKNRVTKKYSNKLFGTTGNYLDKKR